MNLTDRPDRRWSLRRHTLVIGLAIFALLAPTTPSLAATSSGAVFGAAFHDLNMDGVQQADEASLEGHQIYLFTEAGAYVGTRWTAADGSYTFGDLPAGDYDVQYAPGSWWPLQTDWVPTTTGSLLPKMSVNVEGDTTADFGWREIEHSTNVSQPITSFVGANGLQVDSYVDVVSAREVFDAVVSGTIGEEAGNVTIRFGYSNSSSTSSVVTRSGDYYDSFAATVYVSYQSWLEGGPMTLAHEYGHAWSVYHAYIAQQDPDMDSYLEARGLLGDDRLNSSHKWSVRELIAEDYRQLLGPPPARTATQANRDIPDAVDVEGLELFLREIFTEPVAVDPTPEPEPEPEPEPDPDPGPVNVAPIVVAGDDLSVGVATELALSGSVDDDGLPGPGLTTSWSVTYGPDAAYFSNPSDPATRVTFATPGTYVLTLAASDGELSASANLTVTVAEADSPRGKKVGSGNDKPEQCRPAKKC